MGTVSAYGQWIKGGVHQDKWASLTAADDGSWIDAAHIPDKLITVAGTWGGATLVVQGANDDAYADAFTLTDLQGNALSKTANFGEQIQENPKYLRVSTSGGDGTTDLTAWLVSQSQR